MAQTFKDFITECELYPHSQEHFELMKECSELALTEMFIENQEFMTEHAALTEGVTLTEGYLQESVDESTMDVMLEKFQVKKNGLMDKIMTGLKKIIDVFRNFFRKIGNKFDGVTATGQEVRNKLASATITDDDISSLKEIVAGVKSRDGAKFPVAAKQPYLSKIKLGKYTSTDPEVVKLKNDLAAALSDQVVVAQVTTSEGGGGLNKDAIGALPPDAIKDAAWRLAVGDKSMIVGVLTSLASAWKDAHLKGMYIKVNTKEIDKIAEDLQKISDKISEMGRQHSQQGKAGAVLAAGVINAVAKEKIVDPDSDYMDTINQVYTAITTSIGQTMKIYTSLNSYRNGVIAGLESFLKNKKNSEE